MSDENIQQIVESVESIIEYKFSKTDLLIEALTHPSHSKVGTDGLMINYERLEFLGDGVLGLVIAQCLLDKYPNEKEGALAKRQAALVRGESVAKIAKELNIGAYIMMSLGEESLGGRDNKRNIENVLEAIIGAIYQDSGLASSEAFILKHWGPMVEQMIHPPCDAKTELQEWSQGNGLPIPDYTVVGTAGPAHAPIFTMSVSVPGYEETRADGESKKIAEKRAAKILLEKIKSKSDESS